ncbi:sugar-binding transcriptional regulator [Conservatibacter flavescens]|uniref:Sugar-binding protein n=1 Tax=Conservatibacter flavescens TaxID=28161 RepID=A0A2M8S1W1_9PAST|nr:sugar-binding domain-containing protein [Conservatibacter flavescens]PJG85142.1 sugar-binding protein [Conservatibacter flavescens]
MKKYIEDEHLIYKCCCLYYLDNKNQEEISKILKISRPTTSRLLKQGITDGIVAISIKTPESNKTYEIGRRIEDKFNLLDVLVLDNNNLYSYASNKIIFEFINKTLQTASNIGISMGKTLRDLIISINNTLEPNHHKNYTFIPVVGGVGKKNNDMHSNYVTARFAHVFGGTALEFYSPAIFSNSLLAKEFAKEEIVKNVINYYDDLDVLIMGLGSRKDSTLLNEGYIDPQILTDFYIQGAVGDICLNFFDIKGDINKFKSFNERVIGINTNQIKKVPIRVGVSLDENKTDSVYGAINGGYINTLIIDLKSALKLLNKQGIN